MTNRLFSLIIALYGGDGMMHSNDFEAAFSQFLERREYDEAENYLFSMVRLSFAAGWRAAGGDPPQEERIFQLLDPVPKKKE